MIRILVVLLLLAFSCSAQAQSVNTGNFNGNGNSGSASGNLNGILNGTGNNNGSNTINGVRQAPSVYAPGLAASGIETCLGSASVGGSGAGVGVTIGGTFIDRGCQLRLFSRTLFAMGYHRAATQILCNDVDVARALAIEGVDCRTGAYYVGEPVALAPAQAAPRERQARRESHRRHIAGRAVHPKVTAENKSEPAAENKATVAAENK